MDRFIEENIEMTNEDWKNLKSNMDRFIVVALPRGVIFLRI